jgi:hypothetical protein
MRKMDGIPELIITEVMKGIPFEGMDGTPYRAPGSFYQARVKTHNQRIDVEYGPEVSEKNHIIVRVLYSYYSSGARTWSEYRFDVKDPNSIQKARDKVTELMEE